MRTCDICEKEIKENETVIVDKDKKATHATCWFEFHNKGMRERISDPRQLNLPNRNQQPI